MRSLSILMFAFAIAIGISCSAASATAINSGQEYDVGLFVIDLDAETVVYHNHFALSAPMFVMDFHSHKYHVPVTIGKVDAKPKTSIEVRARDSLES